MIEDEESWLVARGSIHRNMDCNLGFRLAWVARNTECNINHIESFNGGGITLYDDILRTSEAWTTYLGTGYVSSTDDRLTRKP